MKELVLPKKGITVCSIANISVVSSWSIPSILKTNVNMYQVTVKFMPYLQSEGQENMSTHANNFNRLKEDPELILKHAQVMWCGFDAETRQHVLTYLRN